MENKILFLGLEVDDKAFHAALVNEQGELVQELACKPSGTALRNKLLPWIDAGHEIRICYEANLKPRPIVSVI